MVWGSELSVLSRMITITFIAKYSIYFQTALMDAADQVKSIGLVACAVINVWLVMFFVWKAVWTAIPGCVILAILAIVWGSISGFSFKKED